MNLNRNLNYETVKVTTRNESDINFDGGVQRDLEDFRAN